MKEKNTQESKVNDNQHEVLRSLDKDKDDCNSIYVVSCEIARDLREKHCKEIGNLEMQQKHLSIKSKYSREKLSLKN